MTLPRDETCGRLTLDGHLTPTCRCYEAGYGQGQGKLEMQAWKPGDAGMETWRPLRQVRVHPLTVDGAVPVLSFCELPSDNLYPKPKPR